MTCVRAIDRVCESMTCVSLCGAIDRPCAGMHIDCTVVTRVSTVSVLLYGDVDVATVRRVGDARPSWRDDMRAMPALELYNVFDRVPG
jgi:hypothetical protein